MPSGCSEQEFKSWIPNIVAIRYLNAIGKLTSEYQTRGENYLAKGYQMVLKRQKSDGSFSLWGETGETSVWLTAYIAKVLGFAKTLISINDATIYKALDFVKKMQKINGNYDDKVHNYFYISKTGSQKGIPLTAFVAIAILENVDYSTKYKSTVDKAIEYIDSSRAHLVDNFDIAISTYALALSNHKNTSAYLEELKDTAIIRDDLMFWHRERNSLKKDESPSIQVEIAAYAIMAFVKAGRGVEAVPIMKWLMTQRQDHGGFYSTTDTVLGIQALAMMATEFHTDVDMDIKVSYENDQKIDFKISSQNAITLQHKEMDRTSRKYSVNANGKGFAFFQVSYSYNTNLEDPVRRFDLTVVPQKNSNPNILHLKICAKFVPIDDDNRSQMTLIEVYLPSGYVYDPATADLVKAVGVRVSLSNPKSLSSNFNKKILFILNRGLKPNKKRPSSFFTLTF